MKDKAEPVAEGLTEKGQQLHNSRMQEEERAAWPKGSGAKQLLPWSLGAWDPICEPSVSMTVKWAINMTYLVTSWRL